MGGNNFERRDRFESNDRPQRTERPQAPTVDLSAITRQVAALESKLNEVLGLLQTQNHKPAQAAAPKAPEKKAEVVAPKKVEKTSPDSKMLVVGKDNTKAIAKKAPEKKVIAKKAVVKKEVVKKEVKKAAPKKVAAKKVAKKTK
jgi:histone H1/5